MEEKHYLQTLFTAPLIKAAMVEKKCGECLTGGKERHARLKPSFLVSQGLHPKEERSVRLILVI